MMAIIVRRRADGSVVSYQAKVKDQNGRWLPSKTFRLKEDALAEEARLRKQRRQGRRALGDDARKTTVNEYWDVWSVENRSGVSPGWQISQNQMYRDYLAPVIGDMTLIDVGTPEVGRVLGRAQSLGKGDQTRKHIYSLLRKMFGDAVEYYEMLERSPVKPKFHRPKVREQKRKFLTPPQAWQLMESVRESYLGPPIWLATLSALRISEVQALRWKSVDLDLGQLLVCAAYNNKTNTFQAYPKQEDWAYVPVPPQLGRYLAQAGQGRGPDDFVSPGPKGGMLSYETFLRALARACQRAGVPVVTPHELRHTSTEIWIHAGASAEDIRRLLNHGSLSATKHYIHRTDTRLTDLARSIGQPKLKLIAGKSSPKSSPIGEQEPYAEEVSAL